MSTKSFGFFGSSVLIVLLSSVATSRGQAPAGQPDEPNTVKVAREATLTALRIACRDESALRGARLRDLTSEGGKLNLSGQVDRGEQVEALTKRLAKAIADSPVLKEAFPGGAIGAALETYPVRSQLLRSLQREFAKGASDPRAIAGLMKQTRLDDAYYDEADRLHFTGLCVHQVAFLLAKRPGLVPAVAGADPIDPLSEISGAIRKQIQALVSDDVYRARGLDKLEIDGIRFEESPTRILQRLAGSDPKLVDLLVEEAVFDGDGVLQLTGLVGGADSAAIVAEALKKEELAKVYRRPDGEELWWLATGLKAGAWHDKLRAGLQGKLASDANLKYARIDRAIFVYPDRGDLQLKIDGVVLRDDDALVGELIRIVREHHPQFFKPPRPLAFNVESGDMARVANPNRGAQARIARNPRLDGVRLDDLSFDAEGRLSVFGLRTEESQQPTLGEELSRALVTLTKRLERPEYAWCMTDSGTIAILAVLRRKTSDYDEACIERLFFDAPEESPVAKSLLVVQGFAPKSQASRVNAKVKEWIADELARRQDLGASRVVIVPRESSLLASLRARVPKVASLEGMRIDRGYYGPENVFIVSGLQDHEGQSAVLGPVLEEVAKDVKQPLPHGWRPGVFQTVPLKPLVAILTAEGFAFPEFDGIAWTRASYDDRSTLIFHGRAVGRRVTPNLLVPQIRKILKLDPSVAVDIAPLDYQSRDPDLAALAVARAMGLIGDGQPAAATESLDSALLHNPEDTTAWYLRAGCSMLRGDNRAAERDVRRLLAIEREFFELSRERNQRLEKIQNYFRISVEKMVSEIRSREPRQYKP